MATPPKSRDIFVGRQDVLRLFGELIGTSCETIRILNIFGGGGSGKTHLLKEFQRICKDQTRCLLLDF